MRKFQKSKVPKFGDKIPMDDRSKAKGNSGVCADKGCAVRTGKERMTPGKNWTLLTYGLSLPWLVLNPFHGDYR